jgi:hypothetical protein
MMVFAGSVGGRSSGACVSVGDKVAVWTSEMGSVGESPGKLQQARENVRTSPSSFVFIGMFNFFLSMRMHS